MRVFWRRFGSCIHRESDTDGPRRDHGRALGLDRRPPPPLIGNGQPFRDHRTMVNAGFWIVNTSKPWREFPERFGSWPSALNRFNCCREDGTLARFWERLQRKLDAEGRLDRIRRWMR
jgi:transposase